jgi:hypothetical protein
MRVCLSEREENTGEASLPRVDRGVDPMGGGPWFGGIAGGVPAPLWYRADPRGSTPSGASYTLSPGRSSQPPGCGKLHYRTCRPAADPHRQIRRPVDRPIPRTLSIRYLPRSSVEQLFFRMFLVDDLKCCVLNPPKAHRLVYTPILMHHPSLVRRRPKHATCGAEWRAGQPISQRQRPHSTRRAGPLVGTKERLLSQLRRQGRHAPPAGVQRAAAPSLVGGHRGIDLGRVDVELDGRVRRRRSGVTNRATTCGEGHSKNNGESAGHGVLFRSGWGFSGTVRASL